MPTNTKLSLAARVIQTDELYRLMKSGTGTADDMRNAAEWLRWMSRFVPDKEQRARADGDQGVVVWRGGKRRSVKRATRTSKT